MIKTKKNDKFLKIIIEMKQIDLSNLLPLKENIFKVISKECFVELDLKEVTYIDSSGIGLIVDIYNNLRNKKGELMLLNVSSDIIEIFEMLNLTKFFKIKNTGS